MLSAFHGTHPVAVLTFLRCCMLQALVGQFLTFSCGHPKRSNCKTGNLASKQGIVRLRWVIKGLFEQQLASVLVHPWLKWPSMRSHSSLQHFMLFVNLTFRLLALVIMS